MPKDASTWENNRANFHRLFGRLYLIRTVSYKFLDKTLKEAGATNKLRAMFRAVYRSVSAYTTAKGVGVDGKFAKSVTFPILRGVLQGDLTSLL